MALTTWQGESFADGQSAGAWRSATRRLAMIIAAIEARWTEYRLLNSLDALPFDVKKDIGYPSADRAHD
jgi:hypothetical protein